MNKELVYIKHKNHHRTNNEVNWRQGCHYCKEAFGWNERFIRIDVETSIFRGDDEVYSFHKKCFGQGLKVLKE